MAARMTPAPTMKRPKVNRWLVALALVYLCFLVAVVGFNAYRHHKEQALSQVRT